MRILAALFLTLAMAMPALAAGRKLVMKDGTYQLVRSYERQGDRIRYYSLERQAWEEVPASLVDWKATEEVNRKEQAEAVEKAREAGVAELTPAENPGPEVAPGVRLPDEDGLYLLENGKLLALEQQQASARMDKGRLLTNVLLPLPVLKNRNLVEIPGARAALRLEQSPAAFFASGRSQENSRYALVRLKPVGDVRRVEAILSHVFSRKPEHSGEYIALNVETIAPEVFRLVPHEPLPPGEYAVVEFLGDKLNLFLWDFGLGK